LFYKLSVSGSIRENKSVPYSFSFLSFSSPDGQLLGFFTPDGARKKVALGGGQAVTILDEINGSVWSFATWLGNNQIVFVEELSILKSVSADGG